MDVRVEDGRPATTVVDGVADVPAAREWLLAHRSDLDTALLRHGSLLVRGLPIGDATAFAVARDVLMDTRVAYREKATPRSDFGDDVFSSTDFPPSHEIGLHNENSYTLDFPGRLLFGCLVAAASGGATTVADAREVLARLPAALVDRFRAQGWELRRSYREHVSLSWRAAFATDDAAQVEKYCADNAIAARWTGADGLVTSQRRSATVHHPETGDEVWFNHLAFWSEHTLDPETRQVLLDSYGPDGLPFQTRHGDGSPVDADDIAAVNAAYDAARRAEPYQAGDLLLVDNLLACHGRQAYTGDRSVVVAMGQPRRLVDCAPTVAAAPGSLAG